MILLPYLPELVCVAGALIWALVSDTRPKLVDAGRLMFFAGLFVTLLIVGHK